MSSKRSDNTNVLLSLNGLIGRLRGDSVDAVLNDYDKQSELMKDNELYNRFKSFFSANQHLLKKEERAGKADKLLFQLAYEEGEGSSISEQAEDLIKKEAVDWPWMKQLNRKKGSGENPNYKTLTHHQASINGAIIIDNEKIISWDEAGSIILWSAKNNMILFQGRHNDSVLGVKLLNEDCFLSYSKDGTIKYWVINKNYCKTFRRHTNWVVGVLAINSSQFLSWGKDDIICLWDLDSDEPKIFAGHKGRINGTMLLNNNFFLSWSVDGIIIKWHLKSNSTQLFEGHKKSVRGLCKFDKNTVASWSFGWTNNYLVSKKQ